jgi:hypothetical protein
LAMPCSSEGTIIRLKKQALFPSQFEVPVKLNALPKQSLLA